MAVNDAYRGYRGDALATLESYNATVWSDVEIRTATGTFAGIILPRSETADPYHIVMKLRSGYNIGIAAGNVRGITVQGRKEAHYKIPEKDFPVDPKKPRVKLFGTGGTIASRLDYRTGAVIPAFSPGELYGSVPELADICNLETEKLYGVFSENMGPEQWIGTAQAIGREIEKGVHGIVIGHGTDTMHHTAADPFVHGPELPGADRDGGLAAIERPTVVGCRAQPDAQREDGRGERHRRGHGVHVRPDVR